ncbi:iron-containing redox enzyme family protein [Lacisediminihabitans sp. H27-G8]|uniref:iron-containing redox enzyme family protein n=1 Tax=Lacisediminihabitans sp. H27-G8 TaxID=3111909 RepID=UPI0038FC9336
MTTISSLQGTGAQPRFVRAPFDDRGPISQKLLALLQTPPVRTLDAQSVITATDTALGDCANILTDDDLQLALFVLYDLHYGHTVDADPLWEWDPSLLTVRRSIEIRFEQALRHTVVPPSVHDHSRASVAAALFEMAAEDTGPGLAKYVARQATDDQLRELLVLRSIYTLMEADPHSWAIPRLTGAPKAALVEIQADEYGAGQPGRMHSSIFAATMAGLGLDTQYGHYVDNVPAVVLASLNMMSMFGLNRSLRGAIVGHLAAFEMTSSIPNKFYGNGFRRLGYGAEVTAYFDEHVAADAVHEQIAARDMAGALAEDNPDLLEDIVFGAAACLAIDDAVARHIFDAWNAGRSALRRPL